MIKHAQKEKPVKQKQKTVKRMKKSRSNSPEVLSKAWYLPGFKWLLAEDIEFWVRFNFLLT